MDLEGLKIEPVVRLNHTPGIYDISNDEYHNSHAISRSMLMDFKKNPYYYWYKYHSGKFEKESPTSVMPFLLLKRGPASKDAGFDPYASGALP